MSDRSLRGMRLGSQSMETESNVQPAPRQRVEYRTADGDRYGPQSPVRKHTSSTATPPQTPKKRSPHVPTGICSWNAAASKSWKRLWKTAWNTTASTTRSKSTVGTP